MPGFVTIDQKAGFVTTKQKAGFVTIEGLFASAHGASARKEFVKHVRRGNYYGD